MRGRPRADSEQGGHVRIASLAGLLVTGYVAASQRSLLGGDGGMLAGLLKTSSDLLERE
jgi:hypothetical protein